MLTGLYTASVLNRAERARLTQLVSLTALLRFFKIQIDCYCVPVSEIFRRCDASLIADCGCASLPRDFGEFISSLKPTPEPAAEALLVSFCAELGGSLRAEQVKSCDYHIARMSELRDAVSAAVQKRQKLNLTLCLSAAGAVVILLL